MVSKCQCDFKVLIWVWCQNMTFVISSVWFQVVLRLCHILALNVDLGWISKDDFLSDGLKAWFQLTFNYIQIVYKISFFKIFKKFSNFLMTKNINNANKTKRINNLTQINTKITRINNSLPVYKT